MFVVGHDLEPTAGSISSQFDGPVESYPLGTENPQQIHSTCQVHYGGYEGTIRDYPAEVV